MLLLAELVKYPVIEIEVKSVKLEQLKSVLEM